LGFLFAILNLSIFQQLRSLEVKTYDEYQDKTAVLIEGEKATNLKSIVKGMDDAAKEICGELNAALKKAEEAFQRVNKSYEPHIGKLLEGTELNGTPIANVGFDLRHLEKYGIAFAKEQTKHPFERFIEALKGNVENGPTYQDDEKIIVEPVGATGHRHW
jgi:hypothetical protein